jgi:phosphoribosylformylglycinamidine synthase
MVSPEDLRFIEESLGRTPTQLERACFENLWSEHCSYRSTRRLLKKLPTTGEEVILGPGDDAAIVRFTDTTALAVGMESHNHPSYVDPHDGAATGVGGIVRDVISMGARPIALMDPLYFGTLDKEKNRYLLEHVVSGIGGYGNCIGVPVVRGELVFDPCYDGNPLVNVVCVGVVDPTKFTTARVKKPGNHLVLVGAMTGRDGIGGASFASRDLGENAEEEERPSVQIGDPFTEKLLIEATLEMVGTGRVVACRDLGAAGLAGASSEMCSTFGGHIRAEKVHLREKGMNPAEIMVSESQERMLLEVSPEDVELIGSIATKYDLQWSDVGEVISEPYYRVTFNDEIVCDLPVDLLTEGAPRCAWPAKPMNNETAYNPPQGNIKELCLKVLAHPEVAHRNWVYDQYDHDVQIRTISSGQDAAVLRVDGLALSMSCGCNPRHIYLNPYAGSANTIIENVSNIACAGGEPLCIVDCLNFASPQNPEVYWQLEQSIDGLSDMARTLNVPVVGGNVSLYNESEEMGTRIKPTPSIGMLGRGPVPTPFTCQNGDRLFLAGSTGEHFGGSILDVITGCGGEAPPVADTAIIANIRSFVQKGECIVTDLSQGGLLAALVAISPDSEVTLPGNLITRLFSETYGRFLIRCRRGRDTGDIPCEEIGKAGGSGLKISGDKETIHIFPEELDEALSAFNQVMNPQ